MKVEEVIKLIESFAPLELQENYDNSGLQVGSEKSEILGVLVCIDITEAVIEEAISLGCNMIVSHHPLLFKGVKKLIDQDYVGRCLIKAVKYNITIYSAHTNLDEAYYGVSFKMAQKLNMQSVSPLVPNNLYTTCGSGVVGLLKERVALKTFLNLVKNVFNAKCVKYNNVTIKKTVQKIALCGGAGGFLIPEAVKQQVDAFITGEIKYHDYFGHEQDLLLIETGHYESEQYTKDLLVEIIKKAWPNMKIEMTKINTNPIYYL